MSAVKAELVSYGVKIVGARLVAGTGGNISAREGDIVWMKPSGVAMDDMVPDDLSGMDLASGDQVQGERKPTSEVNMHLEIYRQRPDIQAIFHTHSAWASGVISAGVQLRPMFAEFVCDLGRVTTVSYITPTTQRLADAMGDAAREHDTIFMVNHGVLAVGLNMKQAYNRCVVVEDAAKSMVAASCVGTPQFFSQEQCDEILSLGAVQHRQNIMDADQ